MKKRFTPSLVPALYDTSPNEDICALVEPGQKVLDIGCATGRIAEKLTKEKNCWVVGMEINKAMAHIARKRCARVITTDLEKLKPLNYPPKFFDLVLFADVLEHCRNPQEILLYLRKYLADSGVILISVPNVANWEIRFKLLLGKFDYRGGTILDDGHLRFFTLETIKQLVEKSGFKISEIRTRNTVLNFFGNLWPTLFGWGFVLKAEKC